jgi:hypothetical protein
MTSNTINPTTSAGTLNIGNVNAATNVEIASSTSRTGILRLGTGDSSTLTGSVHINNGLTTSGNVQILNGAGSTGTITLGTSRTVPSISSTTISLGAPLVPSYSYPIGEGMIGQIIDGTESASLALAANTAKTVSTITITNAGIWLFFAQVIRTIPAATTYFTILLSTGIDSLSNLVGDTDVVSTALAPSQTFTYAISASATNYYLNVVTGEASTASGVIFRAVRIA